MKLTCNYKSPSGEFFLCGSEFTGDKKLVNSLIKRGILEGEVKETFTIKIIKKSELGKKGSIHEVTEDVYEALVLDKKIAELV